MVGNLDEVQLRETRHVAVAACSPTSCCTIGWPSCCTSSRCGGWCWPGSRCGIGPDGLTATVQGEPIDTARHQLDMEVKAITWHGLKVVRDGGGDGGGDKEGWLAEVIVDILMAAVPVKRAVCPATGRHGLTVGDRYGILVRRGRFVLLFSKSGRMPKLQVVM